MKNFIFLVQRILFSFAFALLPSSLCFAGSQQCEAVFAIDTTAQATAQAAIPGSTETTVSDLPSWTELLAHPLRAGHSTGSTEAALKERALKKVEGILQTDPGALLELLTQSQNVTGREALLAQLDTKNAFVGLSAQSPSVLLAQQWVKGRLTIENLEQLVAPIKSSFFSSSKYRKFSAQPALLQLEKTGVTSSQLEAMRENPYLQILPEAASSEIANSGAQLNAQTRLPDARLATDVQIHLVSRVNPELAPLLLAARGQQGSSVSEKLQARFLDALTRERIQRFNHEISSQTQSQAFIFEAAALFIRDIALIAPFEDVANVLPQRLAHVLLLNLDLPPPRSRSVVDRLRVSDSASAGQVLREASYLTSKLLQDAAVRESQGLKLLNSPWCYLPSELGSVQIQIKHQGNAKSFGTKDFALEPEQWLAFVRTNLASNASLRATLESHPESALIELVAAFRDFSSKNNVEFHHDKEGVRDIGLRFADADFLDKLFQQKAVDGKAWQASMDRWYQPEVIWRGHGYRDNPISERDIVAMFKTPDMQLAANPVISAGRAGQDIKHLGVQEIFRYNSSLLDGKVFEVSDDHHKMGTGYQASYGFSTSKSYDVARAFALGAMKVAEYGKQDAAQDRVKTRLTVGIRRAKHYIEMGRLKPLNTDFSYIYGRQQEVMGIGIADPDSVVIAKELNTDKSVLKTYFRSAQTPLEIILIRGDYTPGNPIPVESVEKVVNLQTGAEHPYAEPALGAEVNSASDRESLAEGAASLMPAQNQVSELPKTHLPVGQLAPLNTAPAAQPSLVSKFKKLFSL